VRANHLLVKNYGVLGLHWGLYNVQDPAAVQAAQGELFRLYGEGKVKPLVSESLPLSRAPEAMRRVSSRASVGKLVLVPGGP
jgi:NADPH2:quinone reductase